MCMLWKIVVYFVVIKHKFLLQEIYLLLIQVYCVKWEKKSKDMLHKYTTTLYCYVLLYYLIDTIFLNILLLRSWVLLQLQLSNLVCKFFCVLFMHNIFKKLLKSNLTNDICDKTLTTLYSTCASRVHPLISVHLKCFKQANVVLCSLNICWIEIWICR